MCHLVVRLGSTCPYSLRQLSFCFSFWKTGFGYVGQPGLRLTHLPASASRVLVTGKYHHAQWHTQHCYLALWNFLPGVYHELLLSDYVVAC